MPIAITPDQLALQASIRTMFNEVFLDDVFVPDDCVLGVPSGEFLLTRCLSIVGGTTQILLNQVAERVLGLPR